MNGTLYQWPNMTQGGTYQKNYSIEAANNTIQAPAVAVPTLGNVQSYADPNIGGAIGNLNYGGSYGDFVNQNDFKNLSLRDQNLAIANNNSVVAGMENQQFKDSIVGQASPYIKAGAGVINGTASLASIYTGMQQLKLAKAAESRANEIWQEQLKDLNHVRGVRKRLTTTYMA